MKRLTLVFAAALVCVFERVHGLEDAVQGGRGGRLKKRGPNFT